MEYITFVGKEMRKPAFLVKSTDRQPEPWKRYRLSISESVNQQLFSACWMRGLRKEIDEIVNQYVWEVYCCHSLVCDFADSDSVLSHKLATKEIMYYDLVRKIPDAQKHMDNACSILEEFGLMFRNP